MFHVKFMNFSEKIDIILKVNTLGLNTIEDIEAFCDIGAKTLRKAYNENRAPTNRILVKMVKGLGLNEKWWDTAEGEVFNEKHTGGSKKAQAEFIEIDQHPLVKSYVSELATLRKYVKMLEDENERLRGK